MEKLKDFQDQFNSEIQALMRKHQNNPDLDVAAIIIVYIQAACGLTFEMIGPTEGTKYLIRMVKEIEWYAKNNP